MYKELFDGKKLVTFDMDGTTVRSEKVWELAFRETAKASGIDPLTTGTAGNSVLDRWKQVLSDHQLKPVRSPEELTDLTYKEFLNHLDQLEVTEGFWGFVGQLKLLKKIPTALVTSTPRFIVEQVFEKLELKAVYDFVICGDEVKRVKPEPECYKKTLEQFKLAAKEALAFEDSLSGCVAAARAGIKVICVWDGNTPQRKFPDEVIDYTADFTPFIGEMETTYYEDIQRMAKEEAESKK